MNLRTHVWILELQQIEHLASDLIKYKCIAISVFILILIKDLIKTQIQIIYEYSSEVVRNTKLSCMLPPFLLTKL